MRAASCTDRSSRSRGTAALQRLDRLDHFQRVADVAAERRVHRRQERLGADAGSVADGDQRLGERARRLRRLHERATAGLHVEHQRVDALGDLLAHDRRGDQRDALDGRRHVAQRVERLVGRGDLGGLADHAAADLGQHRLELAEQQAGTEAGDRFELVERPAGVAEGAARHHRHDHAAGGGERGQDQRRLVADAAGAVLVDLQAGQVRQVHLDAGVDHRLGQVGRLLRGHAAQDDRHQQGGNLVLGPGAVRDGPDESLDLVADSAPPSRLRAMTSTARMSGESMSRRR
jgi:hypothetical protein